MATKEVSTWDGLVEALNGFATGDIIKLTADIDLNREYPTGVTSCSFEQTGYEGTSVTIDGNGHQIKNLRTNMTTPADIFVKTNGDSSLTVTFKDLDFVNLILSEAHFISINGTNDDAIVLNNVRFVGKRSGASYLINRNRNVTLESCYFDIPWQGSGSSSRQYISLIPTSSSATSTTANYCWFHEHYTGWTMPAGWTYNDDANSVFFSFSFVKLNGCYIDGDGVCTKETISGMNIDNVLKFITKANAAAYTPSSQNVFDGTVTIMNGIDNGAIKIGNLSGVMKKDVQVPSGSTDISSYSNVADSDVVATNKPFPIKATESQMKDASWLSSQGFDIVVT